VLEHTADIGLRCTASTLEEAFARAAHRMFEIIVRLKTVRPVQTLPISVEAANIEELFVNWLQELLYIWASKRMLLSQFTIKKLDANSVEAEVAGEPYDPGRHHLQSEVKAATYHGLQIEQKDGVWNVQVIFDV
jgi:SHS2 domain-containing protein